MTLNRITIVAACTFIICTAAYAQVEVDHISFKGYSAIGVGGFFNFAVPISEADFVTADFGVNVFSSNEDHVITAPLLVGYRYTFDRSGYGFYAEPNAGYSFGATDIQLINNGNYADQKIAGPATGIGVGYLFEPSGRIQFNLGLRYEHIFGNLGQQLFSFRISHAFTFGRRASY